MESHLEEDSVPFSTGDPDKNDSVRVDVRGPDKNNTSRFVVKDPDKNNKVQIKARGPSDTGGFLGIPENNPRAGEHGKESISLCSSGVSSMNSSLTSSEYRDYEEHSDDDDSRLYGSGTESKLSSTVEVHDPPSLPRNFTTPKPLDAPVKMNDGAKPELGNSLSPNQSSKTHILEAQFPDISDISSNFSQLSIKGDSSRYVNGVRPFTEESTGVTERDIRYRSCEATIDKPDEDLESNQGLLDKLRNLLDKNKMSQRGKKQRNKSYHGDLSQDNTHGQNSQRRGPYDRHPSLQSSVEVYPESFMRNQYGNLPEVMQQYEQHDNENTKTNSNAEGFIFVDESDMEDFIIKYSPERGPLTGTNEQVIQGPPIAPLPPFGQTFHTKGNMYNSVKSVQQTTQYPPYHETDNSGINTLNYVTQTQHNEFWNSQYQISNPDVRPPPQIPIDYGIPNYFETNTKIQNAFINDCNNTCSNQSYSNESGILSSPTFPPINVPNLGHVNMVHYVNQGSGIRKTNMLHNSPTSSNVPSSPASSEKSVPSPSSQTSLKSPAMMQAQSPCPSTPEGNIPNIISDYKSLSVYSSNSSLSSGHSSSSAKAGESPRICNDQDGTMHAIGTSFVSSPDYPHPRYFGPIPEIDDFANTAVKTVEKAIIEKSAERYNDEDDDDEEDEEDERNTPVHCSAYLAEDEFERSMKKYMENDNGSELRRSMNILNGDNRTPLYIAVIRNNIVAVKCFLDQGADPTKDCKRSVGYGHGNYMQYYENVLHLACEKGFEKIVDLLVDHPSKPDLINARRRGDDKTPLLICLNVHDVERNRLSIIRKLLRKGASLNLKETHSGKYPLMLAIEKHEIDFVREELDRLNPDYRRELLEQTDYDGNTCLHFSAQIASSNSNGKPRVNQRALTHTNLKPLTDEEVQRFNSSLNLNGANIAAQNLEKVKPRDLRRPLYLGDLEKVKPKDLRRPLIVFHKDIHRKR